MIPTIGRNVRDGVAVNADTIVEENSRLAECWTNGIEQLANRQ
jgi:hypothetical protein